ncbi:hypothetical protein MMC2321_05410 [Chitinophaga sp. MM2321]
MVLDRFYINECNENNKKPFNKMFQEDKSLTRMILI